MRTYKIAMLPGDGIGFEVMEQAKKVLLALSEIHNLAFEFHERACGFEYFNRTGEIWPEDTFELCKDIADAILLGAIGRMDNTQPLKIGEKSPGAKIVLGLRTELNLFANVRPVILFENVHPKISGIQQRIWQPENVNLVIVRENTEGLYTQKNDWGKYRQEIIDRRVITQLGAERVIKFAFNLASKRAGAPRDGKARVTCVDKANVLNGCRLFRSVFNSVAKKYPEIEPDYSYVDAFTLALLQRPERFDVVVTTNLFGDIITDLAAILQGGLGMAPSANLGKAHGMFEPIHGSAPDITGKSIANPIGMILSTQMMLNWLGDKFNDDGLTVCAGNLYKAIDNYFKAGKNFPKDLGGDANTHYVTRAIIDQIKLLSSNK